MKAEKSNRLWERILSALALAIVVFSIGYIWSAWRKMSYQPEPRIEMKRLFSQLELGQSKLQVQQAFDAGKYKQLKLRGDKDENLWMVSTPFEFGAGNWVLYIEYGKEGKVAAVRFRTNDSMKERPREAAPPDKVAPNWKQPFP